MDKPMLKIPAFTRLCLAMTLSALALPVLAEVVTNPPENSPKLEKISRGLLMQYNGKMIFSPCRERTYVDLVDQTPNQILTRQLQQLGLSQGKPLYVEFFGTPAENTQLKASWLNFAHTTARCQPAANLEEQWRAISGTDLPSNQGEWLLRVTDQAAHLLQSPNPDYVDSPYAPIVRATGAVDLELREQASGNRWEFRHALCRGKDREMLFGWSATLKNGAATVLQGCGWQGF